MSRMLSRLFLASLTLLALGAASSPAASASDDAPRRVLWISGDQRLEYALAEDEAVLVPARQGAPRAHLLPAQAIIGSARGSQLRVRLDAAVRSAGDYRARARALARSTGGEVWAVLRQPGEPADNEPTLLTRWVVVRLQPGAEITEALAGVPLAIEQRAPWDWRGTSWVCRATVDDPLAALTAAELARRRPGVANAEAVLRHPFQRCSTNDPLLFDQRHLLAPGSGGINAAGAWVLRNPRLTGKGVVINVNDDGIEAEHPDLRASVLANAGFSYRENQQQSILVTNWQYTDTVGIQRFQSDNHGTACAGLAAAVGNNGIGVAGVAYEASLVDVQHLGQPTAGNAPYPGDLLAAVLTHNLAASDPQVRPWITTNAFGVPKFRW
ncbi:MAG: S8 family serine peptidase, partial [Planctomycetota bacterium]|nr:S8 family serine peptidase [Planctomycetota bacterium]